MVFGFGVNGCDGRVVADLFGHSSPIISLDLESFSEQGVKWLIDSSDMPSKESHEVASDIGESFEFVVEESCLL